MRNSPSLAEVLASSSVLFDAANDARAFWVAVSLSLVIPPDYMISEANKSRAIHDALRTIAAMLLEIDATLLPSKLRVWAASVILNKTSTAPPAKGADNAPRHWLRNIYILMAVWRVCSRYGVRPTGNPARQNSLTWSGCDAVAIALRMNRKTVENVFLSLSPKTQLLGMNP